MHKALDENLYMKEAFKEARKALSQGEVPVGCIFVLNKGIIARGGNAVNATKNATRHAEIECIDQVLDYISTKNLKREDVFPNIIVIVTVEPCVMCLAALFMLNVKEIIYGCANDRFGGETVANGPKLMQHVIPMRGGVGAEEAMNLLKEFYKGENPSAPKPKPRRN